MDGKAWIAFLAVAILLTASLFPAAGSQQHRIDARNNESDTTRREDAEMIDVTLQICTLDGVEDITKRVPADVAEELASLVVNAREALQTAHNPSAPSEVRTRAHQEIDAFLNTMEEYGFLGEHSPNAVEELLTEGYLLRRGRERHPASILSRFESNEWHENVMCFFTAWGEIVNMFPYNCPVLALRALLMHLFSEMNWGRMVTITYLLGEAVRKTLDLSPFPTTFGHWTIQPYGLFWPTDQHGGMIVQGLNGGTTIQLNKTEAIQATTVGFTGIIISFGITVVFRTAIGFCPYIAYQVA